MAQKLINQGTLTMSSLRGAPSKLLGKRIMSGIQPTNNGAAQLGNYLGVAYYTYKHTI